MKRALVILAVLVASVACGSNGHKPDQAACEKAMVQQFKDAVQTGQTGTEPPSCTGLSDATLQKLAGQAMDEVMSNG